MKNRLKIILLVILALLIAYVTLPAAVKHSARSAGPLDEPPGVGGPKHSAVVLNFGPGDVPSTIGERESAVYFDFEAQGRAVKTGWIGPGTGLLVFDRNVDGLITNGKELFGNHTLGIGPGQTGMDALIREDTNGDGRLDLQDENWRFLQVWLDTNNGETLGRELSSLADLGITSLELFKVPLQRRLPNGNYVQFTGTFRHRQGQRGQLAEVYFQQNDFYRKFSHALTAIVPLENEPLNMGGSGLVRDLPEAVIQSPALREVADRFRRAETRAGQLALMDEMLTAWADTSGLAATLEERAAGRYRVVDNGLGENASEKARRLHVMEAFNGTYFYPLPDELTPAQSPHQNVRLSGPDHRDLTLVFLPRQWALLNQAYEMLKESVYEALASQTRLRPYFQALVFVEPAPGGEAPPEAEPRTADTFDFTGVIELFDQYSAREPADALVDLLDFRIILGGIMELRGVAGDPLAFDQLDQFIAAKLRGVTLTEEQEALFLRMRHNRSLRLTDLPPS